MRLRGQRHDPVALYPRERHGTHCTGDWVGLRSGLDSCGKFRPYRDSIPGSSNPQPVAIPTTLPGPGRGKSVQITGNWWPGKEAGPRIFCIFFRLSRQCHYLSAVHTDPFRRSQIHIATNSLSDLA